LLAILLGFIETIASKARSYGEDVASKARSYIVVPLWYHLDMRPLIRELIGDLETAGFSHRKSQDSHHLYTHRFYRHPAGINLTVPGDLDDIAKIYIINDIRNAMKIIDNERY
jgi:predicted RNA binding protein YcfA (HicA-like mRNA interferase family)